MLKRSVFLDLLVSKEIKKIVSIPLVKTPPPVQNDLSAIDKFKQREIKVKEKIKPQPQLEKETENKVSQKKAEITTKETNPFIETLKKVTVTETNQIKQKVNDEDANHREGYCSHCDNQQVAYEIRDNRTDEVRVRLCQNCCDNKWSIEWDGRLGGTFYKL